MRPVIAALVLLMSAYGYAQDKSDVAPKALAMVPDDKPVLLPVEGARLQLDAETEVEAPEGWYLNRPGMDKLNDRLADYQTTLSDNALERTTLLTENKQLKETTERLAAEPSMDWRVLLFFSLVGVAAGVSITYFAMTHK